MLPLKLELVLIIILELVHTPRKYVFLYFTACDHHPFILELMHTLPLEPMHALALELMNALRLELVTVSLRKE